MTGLARAIYDGTRILITVPKALIGGDDGFVAAAVIIGNGRSATDFAPQTRSLALRAPR